MRENNTNQKNTYYVESAYLYEIGGYDYTEVGKVTDPKILEQNGVNFLGSHDGFEFTTYDTLEEALSYAVTLFRPGSISFSETISTEDVPWIRSFLQKKEEEWCKTKKTKGISEVVSKIESSDPNIYGYRITISDQFADKINAYYSSTIPACLQVYYNEKENSAVYEKSIASCDGQICSFEPVEICDMEYDEIVRFVNNRVKIYETICTEKDIRYSFPLQIQEELSQKILEHFNKQNEISIE